MSAAVSTLLAVPRGDALMASIVVRIEAADFAVETVDLDPRADEPTHCAELLDRVAALSAPGVIGGFSLGARIAAQVCARTQVRALLAFGYPFHRAKDPASGDGLDNLRGVEVPTLIIQGTRDPHGSRDEAAGFDLPEHIRVAWLADGNHRFLPRANSGYSEAEHVAAAAELAIAFLHSHASDRESP